MDFAIPQNEGLERFLKFQNAPALGAGKTVYAWALDEIRAGKKRTHWMWYIFPQLRGLGQSLMSYTFGIADLREAKAYVAHPILGKRLYTCCDALLKLTDISAVEILGHTDAMKLRSSMTLFAQVTEEDSVFTKVLQKYYDGEPDYKTLGLLKTRQFLPDPYKIHILK